MQQVLSAGGKHWNFCLLNKLRVDRCTLDPSMWGTQPSEWHGFLPKTRNTLARLCRACRFGSPDTVIYVPDDDSNLSNKVRTSPFRKDCATEYRTTGPGAELLTGSSINVGDPEADRPADKSCTCLRAEFTQKGLILYVASAPRTAHASWR